MRSKRQAAVQVGRQAGHHSPLLLYYTRSPHLLLDADHPGILVGRYRVSLPSSPPALSPSHISWWVDSCWSGSPTLLLSVVSWATPQEEKELALTLQFFQLFLIQVRADRQSL